MLLVAAKAVIAAVALYFLALGVMALIRPSIARGFLLGFADTPLKHYAELGARLLAGGSFLLVADVSVYPTALASFGWVLVVSTAFMAVMPWRAHHRFARSAVPKALRYLPLIGVVSLLVGILLLWILATGSAAQLT